MILGVIADDFTGATDVAGMLVGAGMHTVQVIGVPEGPMPPSDAVVVALKSRTCAPQEAVQQSLTALRALQAAGARQIYFKYCSTFDSTPQGNIGPVAEALMDALGADQALACPAFPDNARTVYRGHLFVADLLLSDSGMRHHPLTPMTDANLVRVLQAQTRRPVNLLPQPVVAAGPPAVRARMAELGPGLVIADALSNQDLLSLAEACADMPLITAGSGVALGLPAAYARRAWLQPDASATELPPAIGAAAVLSGSCSQATQAQVAQWRADGRASICLDPMDLAASPEAAVQARQAALEALRQGPVLVYATADAESVRRVQHALGAGPAGELIERCLADIAVAMVQAGVRTLVVAGGESSGAVTQALGQRQLRIGPSICPGVPWTQGLWQGQPLWLALKSGNFGGSDFFAQALRLAGVSL